MIDTRPRNVQRFPGALLGWVPLILMIAGCGWYPVIDAGLDQEVGESQAVQLTAINRSAASITAYVWEQVEGPAVQITNADSKSASFIAPFVTEETTLEFQVTAFAALISFEVPVVSGTLPLEVPNTDFTRVTIMPNPAPEVEVGADITVVSGDVVQLFGEAFIDADVALNLRWTQIAGPDVDLSTTRTEATTFTAPLVASNSAVVLQFQLTVTAEPGNTATDTITVVVAASADAAQNLADANDSSDSGETTDPDPVVDSGSGGSDSGTGIE